MPDFALFPPRPPLRCAHNGLFLPYWVGYRWDPSPTYEDEEKGHAPLTVPRQGVRHDGGKGFVPRFGNGCGLLTSCLVSGLHHWVPLGLDMHPGLADGNEDQLMNSLGTVLQGVLRDWGSQLQGPRGRFDWGTEAVDGGSTQAWYDKAYVSVSSLKVEMQ